MNAPFRQPSDAPPPRIAPLAKLPIFFDLTDRPALVIGGTPAAAWKAELLAAAGATVTVVAEEVSAEMATLAETSCGRIRIARRDWIPDDLGGMAMVVADAASEMEAERLASAARAAPVPVNIIDRPAHCDFQFGAIVNRSPVIIGISTDGAAPILAQAIRRRIEALLPRHLGRWAEIAKAMRDTVAARILNPSGRRTFWERFVDAAFAADPDAKSEADIASWINAATPDSPAGSVTLIGAGPGDAEHLTLKAVRALQSADVILFDDLVSEEVLELARRDARRMLVGKRGGRASCRQEDINALMTALARKGKRVARLKSGDPMIFGRAGEEIERLRAEKIAVSVIPGITAAAAMAARLGVSLTHRDSAHSVRFVTGHGRDGGLPPDVDWHAAADRSCTTIVYMGGRLSASIARRLIREGLDPATSAVAVAAVSRPQERVWSGTVAAMAEGAVPCSEDPILIGIGQVFDAVPATGTVHPSRMPAISGAVAAVAA